MPSIPSVSTGALIGTPTVSLRDDWWAAGYVYRRPITMTALVETIPAAHPVSLELDIDLYTQGKVRADVQDIEVVFRGDDGWVWIGRSASTWDVIGLSFALARPISAGQSDTYYLHYGNPLGGGYGRPSYNFGDWIPVSFDDPRVSYTHPTKDWRGGATKTRGAQVAFTFVGDSVRAIAHWGPASPIVEYQIDDAPWREWNLCYPIEFDAPFMYGTLDIVASHHVRVRHSGRAAPHSTGDELRFIGFDYLGALQVDIGAEEILATGWRGGGVGAGGG